MADYSILGFAVHIIWGLTLAFWRKFAASLFRVTEILLNFSV